MADFFRGIIVGICVITSLVFVYFGFVFLNPTFGRNILFLSLLLVESILLFWFLHTKSIANKISQTEFILGFVITNSWFVFILSLVKLYIGV